MMRKDTDSVLVLLFGDSACLCSHLSGRVFQVKEKSSLAINGLLHVSQLKIRLVQRKSVLGAYNILWILI